MSHDPMNAPDSARKPGPLLAVQDLTMRFGGLLAVDLPLSPWATAAALRQALE